jgi:acetyltransferase-like isoleucine patch superfamily enzyme
MISWLYEATVGRLIDAHIRKYLLFRKIVFGDPSRVTIAESALVNNALFNVMSGRIVVGEHAFFGHNVCLLTGTHEVGAALHLRKTAIPAEGRDIIVGPGAWLASNTTILGPCVIGELAVVAAGALVIADVPPYAIVGGVPARVIGQVPRFTEPPNG